MTPLPSAFLAITLGSAPSPVPSFHRSMELVKVPDTEFALNLDSDELEADEDESPAPDEFLDKVTASTKSYGFFQDSELMGTILVEEFKPEGVAVPWMIGLTPNQFAQEFVDSFAEEESFKVESAEQFRMGKRPGIHIHCQGDIEGSTVHLDAVAIGGKYEMITLILFYDDESTDAKKDAENVLNTMTYLDKTWSSKKPLSLQIPSR